MDGEEVPSMSDLCYYIGDWAIKYHSTYTVSGVGGVLSCFSIQM